MIINKHKLYIARIERSSNNFYDVIVDGDCLFSFYDVKNRIDKTADCMIWYVFGSEVVFVVFDDEVVAFYKVCDFEYRDGPVGVGKQPFSELYSGDSSNLVFMNTADLKQCFDNLTNAINKL